MQIKELYDMEPWDWPLNADEIITKVLSDKQADYEERLMAAELAGDVIVIDDDIARILLDIIGSADEQDELRGQAAISLGPALEYADIEEFDDPEDVPISEDMYENIQDTLFDFFEDEQLPKLVRRKVLEASVRSAQEWHHKVVQSAYESADEEWKLTAVFCMPYLSGFDKQILEGLKSKDSAIQYHAVCAAGNWGLNEAWPTVCELANSEEIDKEVRLEAIAALGTIKPKKSLEILNDLIESDDEDVVATAYEALGMAEGILGFFTENEDDLL